MPRLMPDLKRRTVTLETKRRSLDLPTDPGGHLRRVAEGGMRIVRTAVDAGSGAGTELPMFFGNFIPFGQRQWIGSKRYGFWETNEPGCITKTIREKRGENNDITFNRDHDNRLLMARTSNGTLRLSESADYGQAEADLGPYSYSVDFASAVERRDLTGMSYAFDMIGWEWRLAEDGNDWLVHHEFELYDVAGVGMPANVDTTTGLRTDILQVARSAGFDAASFDALARRLADPDPDLIAALRALSREELPPAPVRSTQEPDRDERSRPPAETTDTTEAPIGDGFDALRESRFAIIGKD